jgi:hypothetical protein
MWALWTGIRCSDDRGNRLLTCGHVFCFECLIAFYNGAEWWWLNCPQCKDPIFVPPTPDEMVQDTVDCLRLAQGNQATDTPLIPPNAFDIYFWK